MIEIAGASRTEHDTAIFGGVDEQEADSFMPAETGKQLGKMRVQLLPRHAARSIRERDQPQVARAKNDYIVLSPLTGR